MDPTIQTRGKKATAWAMFEVSVISPNMLLRTPEFPFMMPAKHRLNGIIQQIRYYFTSEILVAPDEELGECF
jgi:hypothetical protein